MRAAAFGIASATFTFAVLCVSGRYTLGILQLRLCSFWHSGPIGDLAEMPWLVTFTQNIKMIIETYAPRNLLGRFWPSMDPYR